MPPARGMVLRRSCAQGNGVVSPSLEPTPEQIQTLASRPADEPVVMVNLLQFRDGGRESYLRYAAEVGPHLQRVGATVRYTGTRTITGHR